MLGMENKRQWIYEQKVTGPWQRLRKATFTLLHLILFVTPWITIRSHPALQIDLPERRLFVFGAIFTAADTIFLLMLLLFLAFSLFFLPHSSAGSGAVSPARRRSFSTPGSDPWRSGSRATGCAGGSGTRLAGASPGSGGRR